MNARPVAVFAVAAACMVAGWWAFLFTCDDAFIAWRYCSNLLEGHGLVWNPPPFRPVEGYTSLFWVLLLAGIWRLTGLEPPETANPILLGAGLAALALFARFTWTMRLSERLAPHRLALLAIVLAATVSNRTWLTWSSSGLEASLLTLGVAAWVVGAAAEIDERRKILALGALSAWIALVRPDGLLFVACAGGMAVLHVLRARTPGSMATFLPFAVPVGHLLWRRSTYGEWLPNTYFAKHAAPWPGAGAVYLSSFLTEYALWIPLLCGIALGARMLRRSEASWPGAVPALAAAAVIGQFAYYTFDIGGDHFEYRIYHHLVPLAWIGFVATLDRLGWTARRALATLLVTLALAQVIPWTHHALTEDLAAVRARNGDPHRISMFFPRGLHLWPLAWEEQQAWLRSRFIGLRRRAHVNYLNEQRVRFPAREPAMLHHSIDRPVIALSGVGYPAWVLPGVAIVDQLGLNDHIVARNPVRRAVRKMAHDRVPPTGYVACFRPNTTARDGVLTVRPRTPPLTDDDIRACEARFAAREEAP